MVLNTPSGYVDLTNGVLHDHDVKMMFTQETGVDFTEKVDCPQWIEFLDQTFNHDQEMIHFVQKAMFADNRLLSACPAIRSFSAETTRIS